jgi:hypothetical protein
MESLVSIDAPIKCGAVPEDPGARPHESVPAEGVGARGHTVTWSADPQAYCSDHERATRRNFAERLSALKGFDFAGEHDPQGIYVRPLYVVPSDTLTSPRIAQSLGIASPHDLFGGVVPHAFVATKAITHGLVGPAAARPEGWSADFAERVSQSVLAGFSSFSHEDARRAGRKLLEAGPVRVKQVRATGGRGQQVAATAGALDECLAGIDAAEMTAYGIVLEENLRQPVTYSVGQVTVGEAVVSYHGSQRLTRDNGGAEVYGGSDLVLVRGGFDVLLAGGNLAPALRLAVDQAMRYHQAVLDCYSGFFASRVNYDVAQGAAQGGAASDANDPGAWRSGVLEQSWRLGGASGAEIAALEHFQRNPACWCVHASTHEEYGEGVAAPPGAIVHYQGIDSRVGPLTKYALLRPHAHTT